MNKSSTITMSLDKHYTAKISPNHELITDGSLDHCNIYKGQNTLAGESNTYTCIPIKYKTLANPKPSIHISLPNASSEIHILTMYQIIPTKPIAY